MSQINNLVYIGVDVSKEHLDVFVSRYDKLFQFEQTEQGLSDLVKTVKSFNPALVVLESTGGLENKAVAYMSADHIPVAVVNPRQIRDFAKATGILAKTDNIDAKVIAMFAQAIKPNITPLPDQTFVLLKEMVVRRLQLIGMLSQEKNRLSCATKPMAKSINKHISWLERELKQLDDDIDNYIKSSPIYHEKVKITMSMPGCGPITASAIVAFMPELGKISNKKVALMAGLAPINNDSGKKQGKRFIRGGRTRVRSALYMAALTAIRYNPHIKAFYQNLIARGKPKKVAITACMRKILITLNAMLRTNTTWSLREPVLMS